LKILIAGYYSAFWHESAWAKALREMGHDVVEFRFKQYFPNNLAGRIQNRFLIGPVVREINEDFIRLVDEAMPDVVLCYRALPISPKTIKRLAATNRDQILISYNNDNAFGELSTKSYWRFYKAAIPHFDLHLAYRESDVPHFANVKSHVLYPHNMPWLHRVLPKNDLTDWESDICFLGHFEPDRRQYELNTLMRKVPAHYRLHGSFWKENGKDMAWKGMDTIELQGEDYVRALNATKIALVFFSTWNADTFTRRVFEIPACGTMMLSQRTETMQSLYVEDKEAVFFSSADELVDKARFYLAHDDARRRIAEAGRLRCIYSGYDIYSRMREWISVVESMRNKAIQ
jgi:hypothetical protein